MNLSLSQELVLSVKQSANVFVFGGFKTCDKDFLTYSGDNSIGNCDNSIGNCQ